jgi:putative oxidoreductase
MNIPAPVAAVSRILIALLFVLAGFGKLTGLEGTAGYIASQGLPAPMVLAFASGALELVAGLALALGWHARIAAGALAAFTLAATLIFHAFWSFPADQAFVQQLMFMKNLAIVGALLFVVSVGAGPASVDQRRGTVAA